MTHQQFLDWLFSPLRCPKCGGDLAYRDGWWDCDRCITRTALPAIDWSDLQK